MGSGAGNASEPRRAAPGLRVKIYMGDDMVGAGKVDLLRLLGREGSFKGAAAAMGVDHARAGFLLDTLQRCFEAPLFTVAEGAPAALTDLGRELIERHDAHAAAVARLSADYLEWLDAHQRRADEDGSG